MNRAGSDAAIEYTHVRIGFDAGDVLRDVSLRAEMHETLVLLGETATGKTLLLKMAAGLVRPDSGSVRVLSAEVSAMPEEELLAFRRQIGFVFQEGALFDSMTVAENVAFRLREENADEAEIESRVRRALRFVEMEHALDLLPSDLSGGMRRRVSIARALITEPALVLYDSPTAGLDPVTSQTIITLILRLRDSLGVTSMIATHRIQDAFALANYKFDAGAGRVMRAAGNGSGLPPTRLVVLRDGGVYFSGDTRALAESGDTYVQRFLV